MFVTLLKQNLMFLFGHTSFKFVNGINKCVDRLSMGPFEHSRMREQTIIENSMHGYQYIRTYIYI